MSFRSRLPTATALTPALGLPLACPSAWNTRVPDPHLPTFSCHSDLSSKIKSPTQKAAPETATRKIHINLFYPRQSNDAWFTACLSSSREVDGDQGPEIPRARQMLSTSGTYWGRTGARTGGTAHAPYRPRAGPGDAPKSKSGTYRSGWIS